MAVIQERKGKNGKTKFRASIRLKDHPPVSATFSRKTEEKKWTARTEEEIKDGRYFKPAEAKKHTIHGLIDHYIEYVLPLKPKNTNSHKTHLNWWRQEIGPAHELLKKFSKVRRLDNPYVFHGKKKGKPAYIRDSWNEAIKKAEIADFRFHDYATQQRLTWL